MKEITVTDDSKTKEDELRDHAVETGRIIFGLNCPEGVVALGKLVNRYMAGLVKAAEAIQQRR
jgi:hypothetical protein